MVTVQQGDQVITKVSRTKCLSKGGEDYGRMGSAIFGLAATLPRFAMAHIPVLIHLSCPSHNPRCGIFAAVIKKGF
jgi:hypothetical protein